MDMEDMKEFVPKKAVDMMVAHLDKAKKEKRVFHPKNWRHMAERFAKELVELIWFQRNFYTWKNGAHRLVPDEAVESHVSKFFAQCYTMGDKCEVRIMPNNLFLKEVMTALRNSFYREIKPPCWLNGRKNPNPTEMVSFPNGLLHVPTGRFESPTSNFFTFNCMEFEYDRKAPKPKRFLKLLNHLWPDDQESQDCLMQFFGYLLTADTSQEKILMLIGPPRSSKSTILRVMEYVLGVNNSVNTDLVALSDPYGLDPLIGKSVAFLPDEDFDYRTSKVGIDRMKRISGEDGVIVRSMRRNPTPEKLPIRFVASVNRVPRLKASAEAMGRRFTLLRTPQHEGEVDPHLTEKLCEEAPGILNLAIAGLRQLIKAKGFIQPESGREDAESVLILGSSVNSFVREMCVVGPEHQIDTHKLRDSYKAWAVDNNEQIFSTREFGVQLKTEFQVKNVQIRGPGGTRPHVYKGIDLS